MIRKWSFAVCCELSFAAAGVSPYCVFARTVHQFCPNNTSFFPTGGAAAPPAPPPRTLMGRLINQDDGLYEQYNSCSHSSATLFGTFPWPQLNDFDVKNHEGTLTFYRRRDWTYDDNFSFLFLNLNRVRTRSIPGNSSMAMFEKKILYVSTKRALPYEA